MSSSLFSLSFMNDSKPKIILFLYNIFASSISFDIAATSWFSSIWDVGSEIPISLISTIMISSLFWGMKRLSFYCLIFDAAGDKSHFGWALILFFSFSDMPTPNRSLILINFKVMFTHPLKDSLKTYTTIWCKPKQK